MSIKRIEPSWTVYVVCFICQLLSLLFCVFISYPLYTLFLSSFFLLSLNDVSKFCLTTNATLYTPTCSSTRSSVQYTRELSEITFFHPLHSLLFFTAFRSLSHLLRHLKTHTHSLTLTHHPRTYTYVYTHTHVEERKHAVVSNFRK